MGDSGGQNVAGTVGTIVAGIISGAKFSGNTPFSTGSLSPSIVSLMLSACSTKRLCSKLRLFRFCLTRSQAALEVLLISQSAPWLEHH